MFGFFIWFFLLVFCFRREFANDIRSDRIAYKDYYQQQHRRLILLHKYSQLTKHKLKPTDDVRWYLDLNFEFNFTPDINIIDIKQEIAYNLNTCEDLILTKPINANDVEIIMPDECYCDDSAWSGPRSHTKCVENCENYFELKNDKKLECYLSTSNHIMKSHLIHFEWYLKWTNDTTTHLDSKLSSLYQIQLIEIDKQVPQNSSYDPYAKASAEDVHDAIIFVRYNNPPFKVNKFVSDIKNDIKAILSNEVNPKVYKSQLKDAHLISNDSQMLKWIPIAILKFVIFFMIVTIICTSRMKNLNHRIQLPIILMVQTQEVTIQ